MHYGLGSVWAPRWQLCCKAKIAQPKFGTTVVVFELVDVHDVETYQKPRPSNVGVTVTKGLRVVALGSTLSSVIDIIIP